MCGDAIEVSFGGILSWIAGCIVYRMNDTCVFFMLAEVLIAFGAACLFGIVSSRVKSMLRHYTIEHCSADILARGMLMHKLGLILSGAAGGIVAVFDRRYIWGFVIFWLAILAVYVHRHMHEDYAQAPRSGTVRVTAAVTAMFQVGWQFIRFNARMRYVFVIGALTAGSFSAVNIQWAIIAEEFWGTWSISPLLILIQMLGFLGILVIRWLLGNNFPLMGLFYWGNG